MHARRLFVRNRALRLRHFVLFFGVLLASLGLLWGCAGDPYANLKISSNTPSLSLQMNIAEDGTVRNDGMNERQITISVTGAPDITSKRVNVTSLDETVARVASVSASGDSTHVTIAAVNSGHTQIKALTAGGGKDIFVDVYVDIPAKAAEVKPGVKFGINKGGSLSFGPQHFNMYASLGAKDSNWSTTLNDMSYELVNSPHGASLTPDGVLSLSANSTVKTGDKIKLRATLVHTGAAIEEIDVYVFEPFSPITFVNPSANTNKITEKEISVNGQTVPVVELIRNGVKNEDTVAAQIKFTANETLWKHGGDTGNYGYFIENHDKNLVHIEDAQNTTFSLFANSTGQSYVDVVIFPIADGGKTKFNGAADAHLQLRQPIKVEIRHVFKKSVTITETVGATETARNENHLQITHNDEVLGGDELVVLKPHGLKPVENERKRFYVTLADGINVNNTDQVPNNNYITFQWAADDTDTLDTVKDKRVWDVFDITYSTRIITDHSADPVMSPALYSRGVPYNALFSITLRDASFIDSTLKLTVKSIQTNSENKPLGEVDITTYGAQSIGSIQTFARYRDAGDGRDVLLSKLYPVRGISDIYQFYLVTDKASISDRFAFSGYDDSLFSFTAESIDTPGGNIARVTVRLMSSSLNYQLSRDYPVRIEYAGGFGIDMKMEVLDPLSVTVDDILIQEVSGEQLYRVIYNTDPGNVNNSKITAFVRINATYGITLPASIMRSGVSVEVDGIELTGDNHFRLTQEKSYNATISLLALNPQVFLGRGVLLSDNVDINLEIIVVNPIVSATLSRSYIQVLSDNTLGADDEEDSKETVTLNMVNVSGTSPKAEDDEVQLSFKLDSATSVDTLENTFVAVRKVRAETPNFDFEIQGLRGNTREIVVRFFVKQVFRVSDTETVVIDFTLGQGIPLYISVRDAIQVQSIKSASELLQIELNGAPKDVQLRAAVSPSAPPNVPHNPTLAYGLEVDGEWAEGADDSVYVEYFEYVGNEKKYYMRLNTITGQFTAINSTYRLGHEFAVIIYSLDSLEDREAEKIPGINPKTFARVPVSVFDNEADEHVITTKQQFLDTFYSGKSSLNGNQTWRSKTTAFNGFYQIAANIDLTGEYLEPIHDFNGHLMGSYAYTTTAGGRKIAQFSITGIELFQPHVAADSTSGVSGQIARYGFISRIGADGIVEGVNFRGVSSFAQPDNAGGAAAASLGVVAAINYGTIRDVAVYVSESRSLSVTVTSSGTVNRLFAGGVVGINNGLIEEDVVGIYATGDIVIPTGRSLDEINAGGLAGANFGKMLGKTAARILEENILTNSDMVISITQAGDFNTQFNTANAFGGFFNAGGAVGYNVGEIRNFSSEAAVYNATRGNSGGLVGRNYASSALLSRSPKASGAVSGFISGSYSNGVLFAQGAIGGLVGRNDGGELRECYYDFYVNTKVRDSLAEIILEYGNPNWVTKSFYAGIVVSGDGTAHSTYNTVVGGVVGINSGGTLTYCFASSAFDIKTKNILGLPFNGDVFINEGRNITVGGLIGRQAGATTVSRSFSNLSVIYQNYSGLISTNFIAGLLGELASGANVKFEYCYSNITFDSHGTIGQTQVAGLLGKSSGSCTFMLCYSTVDTSAVPVNLAGGLSPLAINNAAVTYQSVRYLSSSASIAAGATPVSDLVNMSLSAWTFGAYSALTGFMNSYTSHTGQTADRNALNWTGGVHTTAIGDGMPMIRLQQAGQAKALYIAKPKTITLVLRRHDDSVLYGKGYKKIYGTGRNDRSGFNFVVPQTKSNGDPYGYDTDVTPRAALMFSDGDYYPSSIMANRYYLDDLFTTQVSPAIAARRVAARIDKAGSDVAELGYETVWDEDTELFEAKYYVDVKKPGTFELLVESTRDVNTPPAVKGLVIFDIVDGISYQAIASNFVGTVGYTTLLTADEENGVNFPTKDKVSNDFAVRKNQSFFFRASADSSDWNFLIREADNNPNPDPINPWGSETKFSGNILPNGKVFRYNETGYVVFSFIPYMVSPAGGVYHVRALETRIRIQIYAGATELSLGQSSNKIDGTNSVSFDSKMVTDVTFVNSYESGVPTWTPATTNEQRILELARFSFNDGKNNIPLFGRMNSNLPYNTVTRVPIRSSIEGREQNFTLVFSLREVERAQGSDGYDTYKFKITLSIEVEPDVLYNDREMSYFESGVNAILDGVKGTLSAAEIQYDKNSYGEPLRAKGDVEIYAQDLQNVEFQHYARTENVVNEENGLTPAQGGLTLGEEDGVHGEGQQQSVNIFTEDSAAGLFKVYVHPYFSNIDSFKMISSVFGNPVLNAKGEAVKNDKGEPIIENWRVSFRQKIWDVQRGVYINASTDANAPFVQFSERNGDNTFSWTGVYYIQTNLAYDSGNPTLRVPEGTKFDVTAVFETNGRSITHSTALYALNMPGIYFEYDGEMNAKNSSQAVGTTVSLRVSTVGTVSFSNQRKDGTPLANPFEISVPSNAGLASFIEFKKDESDPNLYSLTLSSEFPYSGSIRNTILVRFNGTVQENGLRLPIEADLNITPVLFKVKGFKLAGIAGNNIHLINQNRQSTVLQAVVSHYTKETDSEVTSFESELFRTVTNEVGKFNGLVNESESVFWEGILGGNRFQLNGTAFEAGSEYYSYNIDKGLNFVLGRSAKTRERFIMASVAESQRSGLSIEVYYVYTNGVPEVKRPSDRTDLSTASAAVNYNVMTIFQSAEDDPVPIYQSDAMQLQYMAAGEHYILMEDIELTDWTPVAFVAASLDGNNKKLSIANFLLPGALPASGQTNIGLFTDVAKDSILKNINLVVPRSLAVDLRNYTFTTHQTGTQSEPNTVNIGALAGTNNGMITNCAVLSDENFTGPLLGERVDYTLSAFKLNTNANDPNANKSRMKGNAPARLDVYSASDQVNVRLGGLVGNNTANGVISNSRVMVDIYMNGTANAANTTDRTINVRSVSVAGIAAVNAGNVVSSFFRDANIVNNAIAKEPSNYTAGVVVTNLAGAAVRGSYAMGMSTGLNTAEGDINYGTVKAGEIWSDGAVGSLVYENAGVISDCWTNIIVVYAPSSAGMCYVNTGTVSNSFAVNIKTLYATHHGFISALGGTLINNKFFNTDNEQNEVAGMVDRVTDIKNLGSFNGFSIDFGSYFGNIWQMTSVGPRPVSANDIAVSIRALSPPIGNTIAATYYYLEGYNYGSARNPLLITDGDKMNKLFYQGTNAAAQDASQTGDSAIDYEQNVFEGHLRLINNISMSEVTGGVQTHKITLRNSVFDGNGLRIDNIIIIANGNEWSLGLKSVGLFSKVEYSTVKNLTLRFDTHGTDSIAAARIPYAGGLAGVSVNSNIMNVHTAPSVLGARNAYIIRGQNFVGGVIGIALNFNQPGETNEYRIEHVSSSMNVEAGQGTADDFPSFISASDYMKFDYRNLGVAGGVIGFVTTNPFAEQETVHALREREYLLKDINGNPIEDALPFAVSVSNIWNEGNISADVSGAVSGGLVGVIDNGVTVKNAVFQPISSNGSLRGRFYAGGIAGANFGTINASRVSRVTQNGTEAVDLRVLTNMSSYISAKWTGFNDEQGELLYERRGLTVGGVTGFNGESGTISGVRVAVNAKDESFQNVLCLGGIVGENRGGRIIGNTISGDIHGGFVMGVLIGRNSINGAVIESNNVGGFTFDNIIKEQNTASATPVGELFLEGGTGADFSVYIFGENVFDNGGPARPGITGGFIGYNTSNTTASGLRNTNTGLGSGVAAFGAESTGI